MRNGLVLAHFVQAAAKRVNCTVCRRSVQQLHCPLSRCHAHVLFTTPVASYPRDAKNEGSIINTRRGFAAEALNPR